jgi:hypothetical protein
MRLNFDALSNPTQKAVGHRGTRGTPNSHAGLARPTMPNDWWDTVGQAPGPMFNKQDEGGHLSHLSHLEQNEVGQREPFIYRHVPLVPPVPPRLGSSATDGSFDREAFEERAAILEFDGGMVRADAEAAAAVICGEALDIERHCWPHTEAMNTAEIDAFTARLHLFTERGLDGTEAEMLADGLVARDREGDGRGVCLECSHLRRGAGLWMCNQWQRAGQTVADVPGDLVKLLQRCDGFKEMTR